MFLADILRSIFFEIVYSLKTGETLLGELVSCILEKGGYFRIILVYLGDRVVLLSKDILSSLTSLFVAIIVSGSRFGI